MRIIAVLCGAWLLALSHSAFAQGYPSKPIRWIVTYPPGGPTDVVARAVGARLTAAWGQQVVIDNRAGAGAVVNHHLLAPCCGKPCSDRARDHIGRPAGRIGDDPADRLARIALR